MKLTDKRFCVYLHKRSDTGEVFYVGSGTLTRANTMSKSVRNSLWYSIYSSVGCNVEIHKQGLSKIEAEEIESALINSLKLTNNLTNIKKVSSNRTLYKKDFEDVLYYSDESVTGLRFFKQPKGRAITTLDAGSLGKRATTSPTYSVCVNFKHYQVHRVIWALIHGECPADMVIDHIDGNGTNNRIDNLRLVSPSQNNKNRASSKPSSLARNVTDFNSKYWSVRDHNNKTWFANKDVLGDEEAMLTCCEFRRRLYLMGKLSEYSLRHLNIKEDGYLPELPFEEIMKRLSPELMETNKSGFHGVSYSTEGFWTYRSMGILANFSVNRLGNDRAKSACIAFSNYHNFKIITPGLPREVHQALNEQKTAGNDLGTKHVSLTKDRLGRLVVVVQKSVKDIGKLQKTKRVENYHEMIKAIRDFSVLAKNFNKG